LKEVVAPLSTQHETKTPELVPQRKLDDLSGSITVTGTRLEFDNVSEGS